MADALLAQSAIDRLQSAAHELVLDGESYRERQKPTITAGLDPPPTTTRTSRPPTMTNPGPGPMPLAFGWSHTPGARQPARYADVVGPEKRDVSATQLIKLMDHASPSTPDDVSITRDGRRLDNPTKVISFIEELNRRLDDPGDHSLDLD